ncbi:SpoVR-like family protein [Desulfatibacillum aliphaticivorans]|uniref:SpoVR-like family protein n=1 Tax=Desulfatibacillum aliphaticivorans TaxID=218208 RepID=B8FIY3_DESAL|nr:SpoVR family protein [Desulfatibacillum aliphaticivorans]ACL04374.1 SpoVR-like family protein [Desulfatibacillum aliphaticivorans]
MELIDQHTKRIMEGCKERARDAGLEFGGDTLEYIVTNRDLVDLGPKNMIPTLYDYWVQDVEVIKERSRYELYPNNPYETVINTRPAISFYNDNNPDWLNVMIFYHVLGHIDFFRNNHLFAHTWHEDFEGQALSDKRYIAKLRSEKGRWVDYVIEFSRGIDNMVGLYSELSSLNRHETPILSRLDYYFDVFLQKEKKVRAGEYLKEIERYNQACRDFPDAPDPVFFAEVAASYPEFEALYSKFKDRRHSRPKDLMSYILENSPFLAKDQNRWMKPVVEIVRKTSLFFAPQIRTKTINEGWSSYWHEKLFLQDDRISGNEVGFARVNAFVTALPFVGLNPYAIGMRLFEHVEELGRGGKISYDFQKLLDANLRKKFSREDVSGGDWVFKVRENFSDFTFINTFVDQEFVDKHKLFVAGRRLNPRKKVWEYYIKSRKAEDYKQMLLDSLYHPPSIDIVEEETNDEHLYLSHRFEGKPLVKEFIANTMMGIEFLWGGPVKLETTELIMPAPEPTGLAAFYAAFATDPFPGSSREPSYRRVVYTMEDRKLSKVVL